MLSRNLKTRSQSVTTLPADFSERNACAEIKIHPSGRFLFVSNRGHDSIARFQLDDRSGELKALGQTSTEKTPRSFDLNPNGQFLFVCGEATNRIAAYRMDERTGELTQTTTVAVGKTPWWITIVDLAQLK